MPRSATLDDPGLTLKQRFHRHLHAPIVDAAHIGVSHAHEHIPRFDGMQETDPAASSTRALATGLVTAVASATIFFDALDLSITQIALPSIQVSLNVSTSVLPWIAAAYVVPYGGFLLLGGRATDLRGARPVLLVGLTIFGIASLACGLVGGASWLIAARTVQGVGAALTVPAAVATLATTFPDGAARARAFGAFSAAGASGFSAGLVLGGVITSGLSWRWIFLAKVPAVALTLVAAARAVPRTPRARRGGYDVPGAATITMAAVLLTYTVTRAGDPTVTSLSILIPLVFAVGFILLFIRVEQRTSRPLLPARLLNRHVVAADAAALTVLAAPFGVSFLVTLYLQEVLNRSAWQTALALLPGSVMSALVANFVTSRLLSRLRLRTVYTAGMVLVTAGDALLIALGPSNATWLVIISALIALGLGMGLSYPVATLAGVTGVKDEDRGAAAGLNNTALQVGGGIGLAAVGAAVSIGLGGNAIAEVDAATAQAAMRYGAVAATALPLLGAAIALIGLPGKPSGGAST